MFDVQHERQDLGRAIRERRDELGLSQQALADAIPGGSQERVWSWETGQSFPRHDTLLLLAQALHLPASTLLARAETIAADRRRQALDGSTASR